MVVVVLEENVCCRDHGRSCTIKTIIPGNDGHTRHVSFRGDGAKCAKSGELVKGEKQLFAHGVERAIVHLPLLAFSVKYPGGMDGDGAIVKEDRHRAYHEIGREACRDRGCT